MYEFTNANPFDFRITHFDDDLRVRPDSLIQDPDEMEQLLIR